MTPDEFEDLRTALRSLSNLDIQGIVVRQDALGDQLSFTEVEDELETVVGIARLLIKEDLGGIPAGELTQFATELGGLSDAVLSAQGFNASSGGNITTIRSGLVSRINAASKKVHKRQLEILSWTTALRSATVAEELASDLEQRVVSLVETAERASTDLSTKSKAADQALLAIRSQSAQAGVASEAVTFADRAAKHKDDAKNWMISVGVFSAVALVWVFLSPSLIAAKGSDTEVLVGGAGRLVVLSLLLFGVGYSARNYSAARHNQIQNEHRVDALNVFDAFVQGAATPEVKDAVLLEATRSIFGGQASGFLRRGSAESQSPSPLVEVVRRVAPGPE